MKKGHRDVALEAVVAQGPHGVKYDENNQPVTLTQC